MDASHSSLTIFTRSWILFRMCVYFLYHWTERDASRPYIYLLIIASFIWKCVVVKPNIPPTFLVESSTKQFPKPIRKDTKSDHITFVLRVLPQRLETSCTASP